MALRDLARMGHGVIWPLRADHLAGAAMVLWASGGGDGGGGADFH